jgi:hypothetical protein
MSGNDVPEAQSSTFDRMTANGSQPDYGSDRAYDRISTFDPNVNSDMLICLHEFAAKLDERKDATDPDPVYFVTNIFGARTGKGSPDLLSGYPVDPKSNPVYRYSIQYLEDQGLLDQFSNSPTDKDGLYDAIVTSVSLFSSDQESFNRSCLSYARAVRLALISLESSATLTYEGGKVCTAIPGSVTVIPAHPTIISSLRCASGKFICVVFGQARTKSYTPPISAKVDLCSVGYPTTRTSSRRQDFGYSSRVSCPDCRRSVTVGPHKESHMAPLADEDPVLVMFACDEEDLLFVEEFGKAVHGDYTEQALFVNSKLAIPDEIRTLWPTIVASQELTKWSQKRGMHDYVVPDRYVSPSLFTRSTGRLMKESGYSLVSVLGHPKLVDRLLYLVPCDGGDGILLRSSAALMQRMKIELQDWSHPCHRIRSSVSEFIREWIAVYDDSCFL